MLRKMYLVQYVEWVKMRQKMNDADIRKKAETDVFADFQDV